MFTFSREQNISVLSQSRIFPTKPQAVPITTPLSILDSTCVNFSPSQAIWYYDAPVPKNSSKPPLSTDTLIVSLKHTLNAYPQLTGQLNYAPYTKSGGNHNHRFGRVQVIYGTLSDPGVEIVVATCSQTLSSIIPTAVDRAGGLGFWDATAEPAADLFPTTSLGLDGNTVLTGMPSLIIQLTTFSCHAMAFGVELAHPLGDAQSLAQFMHDWAATHRTLLNDATIPILEPIFDPQMLDYAAAGDIDGTDPDPNIVETARALPLHRYDWWIKSDGYPEDWAIGVPAKLDEETARAAEPGDRMPWAEWDLSAPVGHYVLHFSGKEIENMWKEVSLDPSPNSQRLSRLDVALSFVWSLINRARGLRNDDEQVHMNVSIGFRKRLSPPLPDRFFGSPILMGHISVSGTEACNEKLAPVARNIRSTLAKFNAPGLAAVLHDSAYDVSPQRFWRAFLGKRHIIMTSWVHQHVYEIDFGTGKPPRYMGAVIPLMDGVMQVTEAAPRRGKDGETGHWAEDGVDFSLRLQKEVLERIVEDPLLRRYRR
ncbi:hypothetical protein MMC14_003126 [Varicellaria rhodocarpa]|nr:hypothetical protein [Varicellaria rhodocarpa]